MDIRKIREIVAQLPKWVLGLPAFGAGLGLVVWIGVLPKEMAIYAGIAAAGEMLALFRRWAQHSPKQQSHVVEGRIEEASMSRSRTTISIVEEEDEEYVEAEVMPPRAIRTDVHKSLGRSDPT